MYDTSDREVRLTANAAVWNFLKAALGETSQSKVVTDRSLVEEFFCQDTGVMEQFRKAYMAGQIDTVEFLPGSTIVKIGEWYED